MRTAVIVMLTGFVLGACSGGSDSTSTPSAPEANPPQMPTTDFVFEGRVLASEYGCPVDGVCSVTVEVTESVAGRTILAGTDVRILEAIGEGFPACYGSWQELAPGTRVIVRAHAGPYDYDLAICESSDYYVTPIGPDPTTARCRPIASPASSAAPTP